MRKQDIDLLKWLPLASVIGSMLVAGAWLVKNVPQTSYIDDLISKELKYIDLKSSENIKYTDDKIAALRTETFSHSDMNRSGMESEYKGLSAKLDMLILMVQTQQGTRK